MMMREIVVFAVVSLMTLTLSSMSIYMSLTKNTSSNNIYVNHNDNAVGKEKRRWIGFVSDDAKTFWIENSHVPHLHNIRKILTCSASSNSFVQILSESSNGDEDVLYSMYAAKRGLESIIIDYTGGQREHFERVLRKNRIDSIRIFSDTIHIKQKSITLRLVLRTDRDAKRAVDHFINLYLSSDPMVVIVDLIPTKQNSDVSSEFELLDIIANANYKIYSTTAQAFVSQLDIITNLEVLYETPKHARETLVFLSGKSNHTQCY